MSKKQKKSKFKLPSLNLLPKAILALRVLNIATFFALLGYFILNSDQIHLNLVRSEVEDKVFKVTNYQGNHGGTGFLVQAPSGKTYLMTNAHVCGALQEEMFVREQMDFLPGFNLYKMHKLKVVEVSQTTDLCLLENPFEGRKGLKLAKGLDLGEEMTLAGHPSLMPLTLIKGTFIEYTRLQVPLPMGYCDKKRNPLGGPWHEMDVEVQTPFGNFKDRMCVGDIPSAAMTTLVGLGGNSGSPVVNFWGNVVGVLFAGRGDTNWSYLIDIKDVTKFLEKR